MDINEVRRLLNQVKVGRKDGDVRPHKVLMFLALVNLIEQDESRENRFFFEEIEPIFMSLMKEFYPAYPHSYLSSLLEYPFYHLQTDGFWKLKVREGKTDLYEQYQNKRLTKKRLLETVEYGYLADYVFEGLKLKSNQKMFEKETKEWLLKNMYSSPRIASHEMIFDRKSLFEHEQMALEKIRAHLGDEFSLINSVLIWDSQTTNYYEYDLIIVGCSGIYVVDLKHWTGTIEVREYQWRIDKTRYRVDPHISNSLKCKILKGICQHEFVTYPNVWVESVVVLTNPEATVQNADSPDVANEMGRHNVTLASISDLVSFLRRREDKVRILDEGQVAAIARLLDSLNRPKQEKQYAVPGYETVEYLVQKPEYVELLARPIGVRGIGLHRLRVFRFVQETKSERERFRRIALNTLGAVRQISDKSYIHEVSILQTEAGDIIEISEWSDTGTLRDLISESKDGWSLQDALIMCSNLASALEQAHERVIIHRAVKPENILVKNGIPKLMNFDLAFQLEDNRLTVMPDTDRVKDDGYVAPEVLLGGDIDESTDLFSLGVIAYQLLTGEKPFRFTREFVARGGRLSRDSIRKLEKANVPSDIIKGINGILVANRSKRVKNIEESLSVLTLDEPMADYEPNPILPPGDQFNVWEIIELIGQGKETQIYKARAPRGKIVALKVFNYETPLERVFGEIDIGSETSSPYVVHYDSTPGHWNHKRYFAVMDYVPGDTLRTLIDGGRKPDRSLFDRATRSLMEGIRALHENKDEDDMEKTIIHGDIKPENIMITPDGKPVLIDLGVAGPPRVELFHGTSEYVPPYSIRGADREFSRKGDLFALGVTLWEWIFGQKPYSNPAVGDYPVMPAVLPEFQDLCTWLTKAVSTRPEEGFATIIEMWHVFIKAKQYIPVVGAEEKKTEDDVDTSSIDQEQNESIEHNYFVDYLNTLSSVSAGNENAIAENQIRSEHFGKIHVPNPVSDEVHRLIDAGKNVILTGNAGDGKTTIAIDVLKKIVSHEICEIREREDIVEHGLVIIKDMSELPREKRALILREAFESRTTKYLIVSNTGTLLDAFDMLKDVLGNQFYDILDALEYSEPRQIAGERFYLLNIGQLDSINTACRVFGRMLESENWTCCHKCVIHADCPISGNVKLIQGNVELVLERVYHLYKCLYEYGHRLTMRQMTGHLAYSLTGGLDCSKIADMSLLERREQLSKAGFCNRFFGDDGIKVSPEATRLAPIRVIQQAGFGTTLMPKFERAMWLKKEAFHIFSPESRETYDLLDSCDSPASRRQIRRLAYFCGRFNAKEGKAFVSTFLNSPMLVDYLDITGNDSPRHLRRMCIEVLHILQEQFVGLRLPEELWKEGKDIYLTLKPPGKTVATQMVIARFRQDDFELVVKPRYQYSSTDRASNKILYLTYEPAQEVELELDLPFFDYAARRYQGEMTHELSAYYANRLEDFRGRLLQVHSKESYSKEGSDILRLLRIRPDRRFEELKLLISKDELEVI